ncbi:putative electron transport oxidoreductase [Periconia macrospinosa]|uniref:Putative electron transport oxidoreductase n=1 Tax=Periconia macrospinosa TaxID=97972 RepID=A0A2V1DWA2_9PLEO|nr:putative electron transport oxidoreductase [Periconia macrospinosa]
MTERTGGSGVSGTETIAIYVPLSKEQDSFKDNNRYTLGPWKLDGFKWFSSGTESQVSVLQARTPNGISAFYAPMRRETLDHWGRKTMELNGVHIQRLKSKIGTRPNTTAELELKGMRAWPLGKEGKGVRNVVVVLTITRLHVAINALGYWARGLAASRAFARVVLAREHIRYRAAYMLLSFAGALLGKREDESMEDQPLERLALVPERKGEAQLLLRVVASPVKAMSARLAISGLAYAMESIGGVGALENDRMDFNVVYVTSDVLECWLGAKLPKRDALQSESETLSSAWKTLRKELTTQSQKYLLTNAIAVMENFYTIFAGAVLADAEVDMDPIAVEVARRWVQVFTAKALLRHDVDSA